MGARYINYLMEYFPLRKIYADITITTMCRVHSCPNMGFRRRDIFPNTGISEEAIMGSIVSPYTVTHGMMFGIEY